jgi:hypothetical protein
LERLGAPWFTATAVPPLLSLLSSLSLPSSLLLLSSLSLPSLLLLLLATV